MSSGVLSSRWGWRSSLTGVLVAALCLTSGLAEAQSAGTLRGLVHDSSGAILPSATVTLTNLSTSQTLETVTTASGAYVFASIAPAEYRLTIALDGFRTFVGERVIVNVAGTTVVDAVLQLAQVAESLTVVGSVPLLQVDTSVLGGVVDQTMMTAVPLSNRNFTQVLALSAGVSAAVPNAGAFGRNSVNIAANGARPSENSVVLDGIVADNPMSQGFDDAGDKTGVPVPSPDAIQEFRVQTGLYDAEYGRQGGAVVNVVTRSGANRLQASAFEFFRDDALNANEFFRNRAGQPTPVLKQNQFGATLGGPVVRDRLFYFASYQGTRQRNGVSASSTRSVFLPTLGDRTPAALGRLYGGQSGLFGGVAVAPDGSNVNPFALALLNARLPNGEYAIPTAQTALTGTTGLSAFSEPATFTEDQVLGSMDLSIAQGQRLSFKWFYANFPSEQPFTTAGGNLPGFGEKNEKSNLNVSATHNWVITPATVHELRVGINRNRMVQLPVEPLKATDVGLQPAVAGIPGLPQISVTGFFSIGPALDNDQHTIINSVEVSNTLSHVRGRHALRVGGSVNTVLVDRYDAFLTRGNMSFASFPDFLLGLSAAENGSAQSNIASAGVANGIAQRYPRMLNLAAFAQDDVRIGDRLAFNLGLRWQFNGPTYDRDGLQGGFDRRLVPTLTRPPAEGSFLGFYVPSAADLGGQLPPGVVQRDFNRLVDEQNWKGFSPRVGMTWRPIGRAQNLVVRGGYGLFWSAVAGTAAEQAYFDPWFTWLTGGGAVGPQASWRAPFPPIPALEQFPLYVPYTYPPTRQTFIVDPQMTQPYTQQWSANVQGEWRRWVVEAGYVGSRGDNFLGLVFPNQALLASPESPVNGETTNTVQNRNLRVPYLGWAPNGIREVQSSFSSRYHALQLSLNRRYAAGLSLRASYTLSRSRDNANAAANGRNQSLAGYTGDYYDFDSNWGPSSFDRTHRLVVSYLWETPAIGGGSIARALLNDWSISGVTTIQSGVPFSVTDTRGGTIFGVASYGQYADGRGPEDTVVDGRVQDRLGRYFDTGVFVAPPAIGSGTGFGNGGRNRLRGPRQGNVDIAISKMIKMGGMRDETRLEIRAEAFNVFNTPQFGLPGANAGAASSFGIISTTVVAPRIVQLAAKFRF